MIVLAAPLSATAASPSLRADYAGLFGELAVFRHDGGGAALFGLAVVPLDLERIAALLRRPEALGDDGDAARHLHDLDHAGHRLGRGGVERFDRRAEQRRTLQHGHQHAGERHVDGELRRAVGLSPARRRAAISGR